MNVLVACEFSGIVRQAFRQRGHDAYSCDLLDAEDGSRYHFRNDVRRVIPLMKWDLMIAHPPCTFLCNSGVRWLYLPKNGHGIQSRNEKRYQDMLAACAFFKELMNAPIERIAIENPIMHSHARDLVGYPTQYIQPYQFGEPETKRTGLWLKNLLKLTPTNIVEGRKPRVHHASPGPDRWKERSRTLKGIAEAMAEQWGAPASSAKERE